MSEAAAGSAQAKLATSATQINHIRETNFGTTLIVCHYQSTNCAIC